MFVGDLALVKPKDHVFFQELTTSNYVILTSASIGSFFSSYNVNAIAPRMKGKELLLNTSCFRGHGRVVVRVVWVVWQNWFTEILAYYNTPIMIKTISLVVSILHGFCVCFVLRQNDWIFAKTGKTTVPAYVPSFMVGSLEKQ